MNVTSDCIQEKLARLEANEPPRVLDLFSGCGGLSLGFQRAGCISLGGVEIDAAASLSYATNFHADAVLDLAEYHAEAKDIISLDPYDLLHRYGYDRPEVVVDMIIGGPPCPTFTRVGRAKLREVHEHPEAFRHDPRWKLYIPYIRFVDELKPLVVLMENVPDIMNFGGENLAEDICDTLEDSGYICSYTLLNAANFGVPQMRERMILLAFHHSLGLEPTFPLPSRRVDFPSGYFGSRDVALKPLRNRGLFDPDDRYVPIPTQPKSAPGPVTVKEAIEDLPEITGHLTGEIKRGPRRFNTAVAYDPEVKPSDYALEMRSWPGFESEGKIWDHAIRSLSDRDYRLFRAMQPGDDYPKAHRLATKLFEEELARLEEAGKPIRPQSKKYKELRRQYVPPYDPGKFPNKWRKMEPDAPARTLMAHLGKDSYSHIHYDSEQARVLSVREAARLQSFPDGFSFCGTMNPALRQIGNAVPPLFAFALANHLRQELAWIDEPLLKASAGA